MGLPWKVPPLPGRHVTDHQMRLYMTFRQTDGPAVSAAKAAISTATAYRFEQDHRLHHRRSGTRAAAVPIRSPSSSIPRSCRC